jgi:hypothetical protein
MSGEERRGSQRRGFARPTEAQVDLYQAVKAHKLDLEIERDAASLDCDLEDRIEATRRVLKWLDEQALEIEPQASRAVQTPPSFTQSSGGFSPLDQAFRRPVP